MNHFNKFLSSGSRSLCAALLFFAVSTPIAAHSATYYVSLTGNDANPGTLSAPFRTFAKALTPLKPGDTLYIRGGLWTTQLDLMSPRVISGTSSAYVTIAGYPGETVTIRYADTVSPGWGPIKARGAQGYLTFENLVLDGINGPNKTGWQLPPGNHHFILRNLEIKNFRSSGLYIEANDVQVINCTIHDQISVSGSTGERWYGIYAHHGSNLLLQGNKIHHNPGGGVQLYPGPISNAVIRGNAIYNNNSLPSSVVGGIIVQGTSTTSISNTQIYNNLVYRNGSSSAGYAPGIQVTYYTNGTKIWNNTVYANNKWGIHIGWNSTTVNTVVQNNISYGNTVGNYYNIGSGTIASNNITTDPGFVDAATNNFALRAGSVAIDRGARLSSVVTDYRNFQRPRGASHDVGGYEY